MFEEGVGARGIMQLSLLMCLHLFSSGFQHPGSEFWVVAVPAVLHVCSAIWGEALALGSSERGMIMREIGFTRLVSPPVLLCVREDWNCLCGACLFGWRIFETRYVSKVVGGKYVKYITVFCCGKTLVIESFFKTFNSNWSKSLLAYFSVYTFISETFSHCLFGSVR